MLRILHHVFALSATFGMIYLYTAEIFPTVTRSTAVGLSSSFARIGGVIAPFIGSLNDILGPQVPLAVFGISAVLAGILTLFLPETMNRKIPDTLEEGKQIKCDWKDGILKPEVKSKNPYI